MDRISFPNLTEIRDYLLIFNIQNVTTLENWFPNLLSIRGETLLEGNALIINSLPKLRRLGLKSLTHIKGGVRIENVNSLCFAQTSDFGVIAEAIKSSESLHKLYITESKGKGFVL